MVGPDENLVNIAVDRKVTTIANVNSLFYGVNPTGLGTDFVIEYDDMVSEVERDIGTRYIPLLVFYYTEDVIVGDNAAYFPPIPPAFNGWNLTYLRAKVITAGTTNATTVDIYNVTDSVSMLTGLLSIPSGATLDDGTTVNIDETHDDVATDDQLRADVKAASTTPPKGLIVVLGFTRP